MFPKKVEWLGKSEYTSRNSARIARVSGSKMKGLVMNPMFSACFSYNELKTRPSAVSTGLHSLHQERFEYNNDDGDLLIFQNKERLHDACCNFVELLQYQYHGAPIVFETLDESVLDWPSQGSSAFGFPKGENGLNPVVWDRAVYLLRWSLGLEEDVPINVINWFEKVEKLPLEKSLKKTRGIFSIDSATASVIRWYWTPITNVIHFSSSGPIRIGIDMTAHLSFYQGNHWYCFDVSRCDSNLTVALQSLVANLAYKAFDIQGDLSLGFTNVLRWVTNSIIRTPSHILLNNRGLRSGVSYTCDLNTLVVLFLFMFALEDTGFDFRSYDRYVEMAMFFFGDDATVEQSFFEDPQMFVRACSKLGVLLKVEYCGPFNFLSGNWSRSCGFRIPLDSSWRDVLAWMNPDWCENFDEITLDMFDALCILYAHADEYDEIIEFREQTIEGFMPTGLQKHMRSYEMISKNQEKKLEDTVVNKLSHSLRKMEDKLVKESVRGVEGGRSFKVGRHLISDHSMHMLNTAIAPDKVKVVGKLTDEFCQPTIVATNSMAVEFQQEGKADHQYSAYMFALTPKLHPNDPEEKKGIYQGELSWDVVGWAYEYDTVGLGYQWANATGFTNDFGYNDDVGIPGNWQYPLEKFTTAVRPTGGYVCMAPNNDFQELQGICYGGTLPIQWVDSINSSNWTPTPSNLCNLLRNSTRFKSFDGVKVRYDVHQDLSQRRFTPWRYLQDEVGTYHSGTAFSNQPAEQYVQIPVVVYLFEDTATGSAGPPSFLDARLHLECIPNRDNPDRGTPSPVDCFYPVLAASAHQFPIVTKANSFKSIFNQIKRWAPALEKAAEGVSYIFPATRPAMKVAQKSIKAATGLL